MLNSGLRRTTHTLRTVPLSAIRRLTGSGLAFELRGRNQNSDKWVAPRIEFWVQPIFAIFECSVFENLIGILDIFFAGRPARRAAARGRDLARPRAAACAARNPACRPGKLQDSVLAVPSIPRWIWSPSCGPEDLLGQVQSGWRSREAIKNFDLQTALSGTVCRTRSPAY